MNKQMRNTLLMIASAFSAVGGLILILTQIVSETKDNTLLFISVMAIQCHLDKVFYDENSISYAVMH